MVIVSFFLGTEKLNRGFILRNALAISIILLGLLSQAQSQMITHGPIVGAVTSESARIMVRIDSQADVNFELDTDSNFTNPISTESAVTELDLDHFAIVDVRDLTPDTKYYYRTMLNGEPQQDVRQFMTFPPEGDAANFSFAFGSCQQAPGDPKSYIGRVFPLLAEEDLRFFLQLGDWHYPDLAYEAAGGIGTFNEDFSRVQESYREKYNPDYSMDELLKIAPVDYVYDDHDYTANDSDMTFPARENSLRGYQTMFPHYPLPNSDNGLWHKFACGSADFFVLDTRTQRHPNTAAFQTGDDGKAVFQPGPEHLILQADPTISGELQMDWLIRELQESTATWKFICTSVPFNPGGRAALELALFLQGEPGFDALAALQGTFSIAEIAVALSDSWRGFPASIQHLVEAVHEAGIQNVVMLSGDSHTAAIDDGAHSLFPEIMAGGLDRTNSSTVALFELFGLFLWNQGGQTSTRNNFNSHYGRVTVNGDDSVEFVIVDEYGDVITSYTLHPGHLVSTTSLEIASQSRNFGEVMVGETATLPIIFVNTGADPVEITQITSSNPAFMLPPDIQTPFEIPPGARVDLAALFVPQAAGDQLGSLSIESNDPESPFTVPLLGMGTEPTIPAGYDNVFSTNLSPGLNMISLPLKPITPYTARSFAEEIGATIVIEYNTDLRRFVGYTLDAPGDGFSIEGDKGYIVNTPEGGTFTFTGAAWTNEPPVEAAPPSIQSHGAWAFVVSGFVLDGDLMGVGKGDYTVVVRNLRTGETFTEAVDASGYFAAAWADMNHIAVVGAGDWVEIAVIDSSGGIASGPFVHEITLEGIRAALIKVQLRLGHIIPAQSALLQNYPNPFNPETWIPYHISIASPVVIRIHNASGRLVRTLNLGYRDAGIYVSRSRTAYWDGKNESGEAVANGIYFYTIQAGDYSATRKMTVAK